VNYVQAIARNKGFRIFVMFAGKRGEEMNVPCEAVCNLFEPMKTLNRVALIGGLGY